MDSVAVVLAAGMGTRMKSDTVKVLHPLCGKPMLSHVLDTLREAGIKRIVVVVGHQHDKVREAIGDDITYVYQAEQLGTGHAVLQAEKELSGYEGPVLVTYGDTPLYTPKTFSSLVDDHVRQGRAATVLSAHFPDPTGYGRIVRKPDGSLDRIVEQKDATEKEREIREINTGTYVFAAPLLFSALKEVKADNAAREYYLPDVLTVLQSRGQGIGIVVAWDPEEAMGINNRVQLAAAERTLRNRIREHLMLSGVTMVAPEMAFIDAEVSIGADTVIYPGAFIEGKTVIGKHCLIGPNTRVVNSTIGDYVNVNQAIILDSEVKTRAEIGPFCYIRPGSVIGEGAKVGDFVEIKNSVIGERAKVPHLSYVGDCDMGARVNFGAGAITCNYDGVQKHRTVIADDAFIGSNSNLVAPVEVGRRAFVAAGSTITKEVGEEALGIARAVQKNIAGWVTRRPVLKKE